MPIAAASSVTESGRSRSAGRERRQAEADREVERHDEEEPGLRRGTGRRTSISPPLSCLFRSIAGSTSGSPPRDSTPRLPAEEEPERRSRPPRTSQTVGERPAHDGPPGFGWIQPHTPERRTPKTSSAEAERREDRADDVELRARLRTARRRCGGSSRRIASTTTTSPANTQRHEKYVVQKPPISGPTATAIAPAAATSPYAARPPLGREVRRRRARRSPAGSAPRRRPRGTTSRSSSTGRLGASAVVNEPHAVDHAADRERALAADRSRRSSRR